MDTHDLFSQPYLFDQLIPYLGNKRKLLPLIKAALDASHASSGLFLDLFAGSGVVSRFAKTLGFQVVANDWEPYALAINDCYIGNDAWDDAEDFRRFGGPEQAFAHLNALAPVPGYASEHWCPDDDEAPDTARERMFFTQENGQRIDAIREELALWEAEGLVGHRERSAVLASLVYAASYVSNTSGLFNAFHNGWGGRTGTALHRIRSQMRLQVPRLHANGQKNAAVSQDAFLLAAAWRQAGTAAEVAYLDPPYNQHPYGSNYHILTSLVLWDKPAVSPDIIPGEKSAIRKDWRTERRSLYTYKAEATAEFTRLVQMIPARVILVSYSTEGLIPLEAMVSAMDGLGGLDVVMQPYKRYRVSSQRSSPKPRTVEFVLISNAAAPRRAAQATEVIQRILKAEADLNSQEPLPDASPNR